MKFACSEEEEKLLMRLINHKPLWKDRSNKTIESISNGISIQPFKTLSSYHLWMRRNIILLPINDEYAFISGSNLIVESFNNPKQTIIPLKSDCYQTSLFFEFSLSNERLIFVGQRVNPNEDSKFYSGRVEIINLDHQILPERIILDHSIYSFYNSYIYDCVMTKNSEIVITILKKDLRNNELTQLFIWNYVTITLISIEEIKSDIINVIANPKKSHAYLMFDKNQVTIVEYYNAKKKLLFLNKFNYTNEEVTDVAFIKDKNLNGIIIAFNSQWFEIIRFSDDSNDSSKYISEIYLRFDLLTILDSNWIDIEVIDQADLQSRREANSITDNIVSFDTLTFTPNFGLEKPVINEKKNFIKYVISRQNYILFFLQNSPVLIIFEFIEVDEMTMIKVSSIDKIVHVINPKTSILFNTKLNQMILAIVDKPNEELESMNLLQLNTSNKQKGDDERNSFTPVVLQVNYFKYKINFVDNSPNFVYDKEILKYTSPGGPINNIFISDIPRLLLVNSGEDNREIIIYEQKLRGKDSEHKPSACETDQELDIPNFIKSQTQFYKEQIDINVFMTMTLREKPCYIAFSPISRSFFVAFHEGGVMYSIIGSEIKMTSRIYNYCKACAFSATGKYFCFSTTEFENDYQIQILNLTTNQFDFLIEKIPQPVKLMFHERDHVLSALFKDNLLNLIIWKLGWQKKHIINPSLSTKLKDDEDDDSYVLVKISDFSENINDYTYDCHLDHCLITSVDKRVRIYTGYQIKDEKHWEFFADVEYHCVLLIKKLDIILFGTTNGSIRSLLWPISNMLRESIIDHPDYSETSLHSSRITSIIVSNDEKFLYTAAEDGSIFISSLHCIHHDTPVTVESYMYFNPANVIPKKMYFTYSDMLIVTDSYYQAKVNVLKEKKLLIQNRINEFGLNKEKAINQSCEELEQRKSDLTYHLECKVNAVKEKGNEKERETMKMKEEREKQNKAGEELLKGMKSEFKKQKELQQKEVNELSEHIKVAREKVNKRLKELDQLRTQTNTKIAGCLENMHVTLQEKKAEIVKMIEIKENKFKDECIQHEQVYENEIRQKEKDHKNQTEEYARIIKENTDDIRNKIKDNRNYKEKIHEWENHLKDLKKNNEELMETFLMDKLKLYQMHQLLVDNEEKISAKEKIVKEKRLINDRLEQLRYVLQYQINSLVLEKTPIEAQLKNFESLHGDFYKRFNLLYNEMLNITDLMSNNEKCIKTYSHELINTKNKLYGLKNLYKAISIELNTILRNKLDNKRDILKQIGDVYLKYLVNFSDGKEHDKIITHEMKHQNKLIEKEIYHQKNNVLKEYIDKRHERTVVNIEKDNMMKDIRLDNQLLIQECSNIRSNLEDILKNINDIEKKFIELTNNNSDLDNHEKEQIQNIQGHIKEARTNILVQKGEKVKVLKEVRNNSMTDLRRITLSKNDSTTNLKSVISPYGLLKKQQVNTFEIRNQNDEVEKMQQKLKELIGSPIKVNPLKEKNENGKIDDELSNNNMKRLFKRKLSNVSKNSKDNSTKKTLPQSHSVIVKVKKFTK